MWHQGVIKAKCPKCSKGGHQGRKYKNNKGAQNISWKRKPPQSGEATTKTVNSTVFYWCAKCKRWTTTHSTEEHTGKKNVNPSSDAANLLIDPSAWCMSIDYPDYSECQPVQASKPTWFNMFKWLHLSITAGYFLWIWFPDMLPLMAQLFQNIAELSSFLSKQWTYVAPTLAPLTWFMSGFLAYHLNCPKKIGNDEQITRANSRTHASKRHYRLQRSWIVS